VKVGDLIKDNADGDVGIIVREGLGYLPPVEGGPRMRSFIIKWNSLEHLSELGEDSLHAGLIEKIQEA
jgi:hypothetical protein